MNLTFLNWFITVNSLIQNKAKWWPVLLLIKRNKVSAPTQFLKLLFPLLSPHFLLLLIHFVELGLNHLNDFAVLNVIHWLKFCIHWILQWRWTLISLLIVVYLLLIHDLLQNGIDFEAFVAHKWIFIVVYVWELILLS